ncbi:MAG TPA: xanthine dehydrogenase family protein molybdopterin-binding subunit [Syntrophorhabdaceae bacterium]|nr:xanthine dehydrogenase family protein molybdopterin-binding subunit [Syntrophorhabdaceae bacterium]
MTVRDDAWAKCCGKAGYMDELSFPGMLHVMVVRSQLPRAGIRSVHVPAVASGYYVIDSTDIPGRNVCAILKQDFPLLAEDRVSFAGQAILLIAGPERDRILEINDGIRIDYEPEEPVITIEDAEEGRIPPVFGTDNVIASIGFERGDVEKTFIESARVFEDEFRTGYQEHLYLETLRAIAVPEEGRMTVYGPFQIPDIVPVAVSIPLGWNTDRIRARVTTIGGAFGGKMETTTQITCLSALAAYVTQRPCSIVYDREEDITTTSKRHPSRIRIKSGVDQNKRVRAVKMDIDLLGGACFGSSAVVLDSSVKMATGPYRFENVSVRGRALATNHIMPGATRGFGVVQTTFAIETHMSHVARQLGIDPLDFRLGHVLKQGDRTSTDAVLRDQVKIPEIVKSVDAMSGYRAKRGRQAGSDATVKKGIGIALYSFGAPHTVKGTLRARPRPLILRRTGSGDVVILTTITELGQGIVTVFREIASRILDIPIERISMDNPDTDRDPSTLGTGASLGVTLFGKSVERAARKLKDRWDEPGEIEVMEDYVEPGYLEWDDKRVVGDAFHTYSWGAVAVEVSVDLLTCEVQVTGVWAAHDIGRPINDRLAEGQVDGALVQGLGFGLMEVLESKEGILQQSRLRDYTIPTMRDIPAIRQFFVINPYSEGPFGAKSVGEIPTIGAAAALGEAVADALGIEVGRLPITPEYLLDLVRAKEASS